MANGDGDATSAKTAKANVRANAMGETESGRTRARTRKRQYDEGGRWRPDWYPSTLFVQQGGGRIGRIHRDCISCL
jgi:hypothetical protein